MTREFPDELLSAFLDDELTAAEREAVERHLSSNAPDRQLVAELKTLKADVASLPKVKLKPEFTDRVVKAAVARRNHPAVRIRRHAWTVASAVGAALAACALLMVQPWRRDAGSAGPVANAGGENQSVATVVEQVAQPIASLLGVVPADNEAVVLRLRLNDGVSLMAAIDQAMKEAGIQARPGVDGARSGELAAAYAKLLQGKSADETAAAAEAIFIEAPLKQLDRALAALQATAKGAVELSDPARFAYRSELAAEGEPGSGSNQPFAQRLNATLFKLEKKAAEAVAAVTGNNPPIANLDKPVRVLLLVEP